MEYSFSQLFFVNKNIFPVEKQELHESHHQKRSWVYYAIMALGLWLIAIPPTFGYNNQFFIIHDILFGFLIIIFAFLSLKPYNLWAQWAIVFIGIWFFVVPFAFWADKAVIYINETLVGILLVTFGIVIPEQPGIRLFEEKGKNVPPGWSYNPSSWSERIPVITLAWLGFFVAQYMGAFQLNFIKEVWDPFFGDGTKNVLTSDVSKSFPVSDAALGAFAYIMDILMGLVGNTHRWRTMPWVVIIFGILIIPLGVVSITLVILQPVAVGSWCTLCLFSATVSLIMIPFTLDEVLATVQMIRFEMKRGKKFWKLFWFGGTMIGGEDEKTPQQQILLISTGKSIVNDFFIKPWNLWLSAATGLWLMAAPQILGYSGSLSHSHIITGALVSTFSVISMSEVARPLRFINILFAIWIIVSYWLFNNENTSVLIHSIVSGLILIPFAFPKGKVESKRGSFDKLIF